MTKDDVMELTVAELVSQPELFSGAAAVEAAALAVDSELVSAASTARRPVTGARVAKNEARALLIGAMKLRGSSDRQIARAVGCDPRSITRVMERLEASGVVPALKYRLAGKMGRLAEATTDELQSLVDAADWDRDSTAAVKGLAVLAGIATEKTLLLTGQATEISAKVPAGSILAPEELTAWLRSGKTTPAGPAGPADPKSDVHGSNAPVIEVSALPDTATDTHQTAPGGSAAPQMPAGSGRAAAPPTGGEGVARDGGGTDINGSGSPRNSSHTPKGSR